MSDNCFNSTRREAYSYICTHIIHWLIVEVGFINLGGIVEQEVLPQLLVSSSKQLVEDVEVSFSLWSLGYSKLLKEKCLKRGYMKKGRRRRGG